MKVLMAGHGGPIRKDDEIFIEQLRSRFPDITFEAGGSNEEQLTQVVDAEVYHGWPQREVFLAAKNMKWLHVPGTGIDDGIFGTPELSDSDIIVTNCRGPHAPPMADHVMGMILTIAHRLREQWEDQQNHYWDTNKYNNLLGLNGKTIGILAAGDIGSQIAKRAHGFGMNVYAVDKHPDVVKERNNGNIPEGIDHLWNLNKLDEMLEYCSNKFYELKINTNATKLTEKLIHKILQSGVTDVVFSVDSYKKDDYERIRVQGIFESVVDNIKKFAEIRREFYPESKCATRVSGVRVDKELDEFLSLNFIPRVGGGIGITRLLHAMNEYTIRQIVANM